MSNLRDVLPEFVVNTNTNIIFQYAENPLYISKEDGREKNKHKKKARTGNESRKFAYQRVKVDASLDPKKQFPRSRVNKYLAYGYFIECKNLTAARYHQAKLRYEKATDENTKAELREIMEEIMEKSPHCLI